MGRKETKNYEWQGSLYSMSELSRMSGYSRQNAYRRIKAHGVESLFNGRDYNKDRKPGQCIQADITTQTHHYGELSQNRIVEIRKKYNMYRTKKGWNVNLTKDQIDTLAACILSP